jgi:hypothetical protein
MVIKKIDFVQRLFFLKRNLNRRNKNLTAIVFAVTIFLTSCGIPKDVIRKIQSGKKEMIELPIDYAILFPKLTFEQWDQDYNSYNRFLTKDIMRTQMGLSYEVDGVQIWWCIPSAKTHVQLDTATMINDNKAVIGGWRIACDRKISYTDSAVYADKQIYRDYKVFADEKDDDVFLAITDTKFKLYSKQNGKKHFKSMTSKNYSIESGRFLMLYENSKTAAAISFIGIDKEERLIINSYAVQERKKKNVYITYEAVMSQLIFKRAAY